MREISRRKLFGFVASAPLAVKAAVRAAGPPGLAPASGAIWFNQRWFLTAGGTIYHSAKLDDPLNFHLRVTDV